VLRQYQRGLRRGNDGKLAGHDFTFHEAPVWAQRDRAWVLEAEWKALVPAKPVAGSTVDIPAALKSRLIRYHFVEALVGEPGTWAPTHILSAPLKLTVDSVSESAVRFHLEGPVQLATSLDPSTAKCGLDGNLAGALNYNRAKNAFDRFDLVLIADSWGALNGHNAVSREGRNPVGFAFELGTGADVDNVPPQGARVLQAYLKP
jgi:hypothetical protein